MSDLKDLKGQIRAEFERMADAAVKGSLSMSEYQNCLRRIDDLSKQIYYKGLTDGHNEHALMIRSGLLELAGKME
jgi:hypothetical protein